MRWEEWIYSEAFQEILHKSAMIIHKKIQRRVLSHLFCGTSVSTEEIKSVLWIYVQDHAGDWNARKPLDLLLKLGHRYIVSWISKRFIMYQRDKIRTSKVSPEAYLYSRLRSVLSSNKVISTKTSSNSTYYCCDRKLPYDSNNVYLMGNVDFMGWPFPESISMANIFETKSIIAVAEYFWYEVVNRVSRHVWVSVRDLKDYIKSFIVLPSWVHEDNSGIPESDIKDGHWGSDDLWAELELIRSRIVSLAELCALQLNVKEREVFFRVVGENQTLAIISEAMGYSGASAIAYIRNRAYEKIREFCVAEPFLSPPDLNKEIFDEFVENLLNFCKKSLKKTV